MRIKRLRCIWIYFLIKLSIQNEFIFSLKSEFFENQLKTFLRAEGLTIVVPIYTDLVFYAHYFYAIFFTRKFCYLINFRILFFYARSVYKKCKSTVVKTAIIFTPHFFYAKIFFGSPWRKKRGQCTWCQCSAENSFLYRLYRSIVDPFHFASILMSWPYWMTWEWDWKQKLIRSLKFSNSVIP